MPIATVSKCSCDPCCLTQIYTQSASFRSIQFGFRVGSENCASQFSGSETALVVNASRAILLNPPSEEGGYNNCGYGKLATRRPWRGVAGSTRGRRPGGLALGGRE